jgi:hypothetical protein
MEAIFCKENFQQLSELGSKFNLSFSSQTIIGNKLIALDGIKKSLLVLETDNKSYIIQLDKVASVSVKKTYNSIRPGELNNKGIEEFLNTIELQFEYSNNKGTVSLLFYDCKEDDLHKLPMLERNAKNWQMILSKMTSVPANKMIKEEKS